MLIDATRLGPKLYQGSFPVQAVAPLGIDVLVLCARELQTRSAEPGLVTLRCPLDDHANAVLSRGDWQNALRTGALVARYIRSGRRVLVTCAAGRNRSGLVSAIALHELTGRSGKECIEHIQSRRLNALTNDDFVAALRIGLPPKAVERFDPRRGAAERVRHVPELHGRVRRNQRRHALLGHF